MFDSDGEDEDAEVNQPQTFLSPLIRSIILFLLLWHFLFNVSDSGMSLLFLFIYNLLKLLHSISGSEVAADWVTSFPSTLQSAHKAIIGEDIKFKEYVVCPKCHSLYDVDHCIVQSGSVRSSRKCQYIEFPQHPMTNP